MYPVDPDEPIRVTVFVRARSPIQKDRLETLSAQPVAERQYPSRSEYAAEHGALPADLLAVEAFASQHGLDVEESSIPRRSVLLSGPARAIGLAFGVDLGRSSSDPEAPHFPSGPIRLPTELAPIVETVVGLDNRPHAQPHDGGEH